MTMNKEALEHLRNLCRRALASHTVDQGSANIVIYAAEFHALEDAIRMLSRKPKTPFLPHHIFAEKK